MDGAPSAHLVVPTLEVLVEFALEVARRRDGADALALGGGGRLLELGLLAQQFVEAPRLREGERGRGWEIDR